MYIYIYPEFSHDFQYFWLDTAINSINAQQISTKNSHHQFHPSWSQPWRVNGSFWFIVFSKTLPAGRQTPVFSARRSADLNRDTRFAMAGLKPRSALTLEPRNLPEGWEMHKDKQGRSYYANKELLLERCEWWIFLGWELGVRVKDVKVEKWQFVALRYVNI